jgi:acetolactate synthase-1/3 small subunit
VSGATETTPAPAEAQRHHILSVLVENRPGVLNRVAGLIARRGYNIHSLAVAPTEDERFSRITMVVDVVSSPLPQMIKQLDKLVNVIQISELAPADAVARELLLCTVRADGSARDEVVALAAEHDAAVLDEGDGALTISLDARPDQLDAFEERLRPYGIVFVQRSGWVALPVLGRGADA